MLLADLGVAGEAIERLLRRHPSLEAPRPNHGHRRGRHRQSAGPLRIARDRARQTASSHTSRTRWRRIHRMLQKQELAATKISTSGRGANNFM